jgi:PAS domain S-box-containing protein
MSQGGSPADPIPCNLLLVDDDPAQLATLQALLAVLGHPTVTARSGEEALRRLQETDFAVVLLDVRMPDLNGFETAKRIRLCDTSRHTPIIFLTACVGDEFPVEQAYALGAVDYLVKPVVPETLRAKVAVFIDIAQGNSQIQRQAAELRAREKAAQREQWRVTLASIGDAVIVADPQERITFLNPVAQGMTGWEEKEALGRHVGEVFCALGGSSQQPLADPVLAVIATGQPVRQGDGLMLRSRAGTLYPIEAGAFPVTAEGEGLSGVVLVFRDDGERRRREEILQQPTQILAENDRRKDEFLATLAHELRNPLAPIRNSLNILRLRCPEDAMIATVLNMLDRQVNHMVRLVDDMLDVSRITRGKIDLHKGVVDAGTLLARAVETTRPLLDERQQQVRILRPDVPLWVEVDVARLEQVLANLVNNAAKYSEPGNTIDLEARREGEHVVFSVRDAGIGIRAEMLPLIFDMFQQADRLSGHVSEGLGIGLTLVRCLVQMHGGEISAHSEGPGKGSTFSVRLPLCSSQSASPPAFQESARGRVKNLHILICDDNKDAARTLAMLLELDDHRVEVAHHGRMALSMFRASRPDVVVLDIGLPELSGYEVARLLRQEPGGEQVCLIALTGYGQESDRTRAREAGFDAHLVKPAAIEQVRDVLVHVSAGRGVGA